MNNAIQVQILACHEHEVVHSLSLCLKKKKIYLMVYAGTPPPPLSPRPAPLHTRTTHPPPSQIHNSILYIVKNLGRNPIKKTELACLAKSGKWHGKVSGGQTGWNCTLLIIRGGCDTCVEGLVVGGARGGAAGVMLPYCPHQIPINSAGDSVSFGLRR